MVEKYGFVYIWFDVRKNMYYVGCHWGNETDGYICSSKWMRDAYRRRPQDFRRRVIKTNLSREQMFLEEQRYFNMIKPEEVKSRYYNLNIKNNEVWHKYDENIKTVGEKISAVKKGKTIGPCSPEKAKAISEAKKKKFAERGGMSDQHRAAITGIKKKPHTDEWKAANSTRMKEQWSNGTRKRAELKQTMTREQQDKLCSEGLQARWSNPEWKARQIEALKAAWVKRKAKLR